MRSFLFCAVFGGLSAVGSALSFSGSDWAFDYNATLRVRTALSNQDVPLAGSSPVVVSQSSAGAFSFPYALGPISGTGDFTVTGTTVTDVNTGRTTDPFTVELNGSSVLTRVTYPTFTLTGTVTGVNPDFVDGFGARAFEVTGGAVTVSNVRIEVFSFGIWLDLGNQSSVVLNSWGMSREAVPEPLTFLGLASLAAWAGVRRRRSGGG